MPLDAADENKGVLLRKQSVPHWKKCNQICDSQSGGELGGRQRAWSHVSVDMGCFASASCSRAIARTTGIPSPAQMHLTEAAHTEQHIPKACC